MQRIMRIWRRTADRLSMGGRLRLLQPWALVPGPAVLLIALAAPYRWLFFLAYALMLVVLACYLWARHVGPRVALRRRLGSAWAEVGDTLEERWELTNGALLPLIWLEIDDASDLPGYTSRRVAAAGPRETAAWATEARCTRRGVFTLGPLTARLADPLGIFSYQWRQGEPRQIVIYPPLVRLPEIRVPEGLRGGLARADLLQQFVTPSVGGLREYVPGDQPGRIHWPTVARTQRLMVKEFDQERAGALWIALDLCAAAYPAAQAIGGADGDRAKASGPAPQTYGQSSRIAEEQRGGALDTPLELAIVLACSLAAQALAEGRAVGLFADDGRQRMVAPGQGPRQLWRILIALVDAGAGGAVPLGRLIRQGRSAFAGAAGTALAVVTPDLAGEWLADLAEWQPGRGGGALALLVASGAVQPGALETRLAGLNVAARTFRVGAALPPLHPPKPRSVARISPLGRVYRS